MHNGVPIEKAFPTLKSLTSVISAAMAIKFSEFASGGTWNAETWQMVLPKG